jgi:hypothetical protein
MQDRIFHHYHLLLSSFMSGELFALLTIWEDWRAAIERKKTDERRFSPLGRRIGSFHPLIGLDSRFSGKLLPLPVFDGFVPSMNHIQAAVLSLFSFTDQTSDRMR